MHILSSSSISRICYWLIASSCELSSQPCLQDPRVTQPWTTQTDMFSTGQTPALQMVAVGIPTKAWQIPSLASRCNYLYCLVCYHDLHARLASTAHAHMVHDSVNSRGFLWVSSVNSPLSGAPSNSSKQSSLLATSVEHCLLRTSGPCHTLSYNHVFCWLPRPFSPQQYT